MIKVIFLQGTATHLAASLRSMAYFNSRTLGFYPGVDAEDKEDKGIPDELMLDEYEWDSYDDDPYQDIRPHLSMESVNSQINGYPGQALNHISVTPVIVATAGAGEKMREPPDMDQDQELPVTSEEKRGEVSPAQGNLNTSLSVAEKSSHDSHTKASYSQYRKYQQPHEEQETDIQEIVPVNISDIRRMEEPLPEKFTESCNTVYDINQCEVLCTFTLSSLQLETVAPMDVRTDVTMVQQEVVHSAMEKPAEEDPEKDSKKPAKEDPEKDSKKVAKEDPEKDSKKAAKNVPKKDSKKVTEASPKVENGESHDARPDDSIIDYEKLLEDFEASISATNNSDLKIDGNPSTKYFDLITLCGHPLTIFKSDLDSLQERKYVTEGVVEYYLDVIFQEIDVRIRKDIHILSSAIFPTLKHRAKMGNERPLQITENIFNKKFVILPICHQSHWIIAVATRFKH